MTDTEAFGLIRLIETIAGRATNETERELIRQCVQRISAGGSAVSFPRVIGKTSGDVIQTLTHLIGEVSNHAARLDAVDARLERLEARDPLAGLVRETEA